MFRKILILLAVYLAFTLSGCSSLNQALYSKIDQTKMEKNVPDSGVIRPNGGMPYQYTLDAYDENGQKYEVVFGTEKPLKEDHHILLEKSPLRGIISWQEVSLEDLPEKAAAHYKQ